MKKRRVFYSFHYEPDYWRTAQVREIGAIEGNQLANDNDWEKVKRGGNAAIKKWIDDQLHGRSCTVVLVGANTASRKWIKYEIIESWKQGMGVVGICIHGLKDVEGCIATPGKNPFDYINIKDRQQKLSTIVKCYNPAGRSSTEKYRWIAKHLAKVVEEAIQIRSGY